MDASSGSDEDFDFLYMAKIISLPSVGLRWREWMNEWTRKKWNEKMKRKWGGRGATFYSELKSFTVSISSFFCLFPCQMSNCRDQVVDFILWVWEWGSVAEKELQREINLIQLGLLISQLGHRSWSENWLEEIPLSLSLSTTYPYIDSPG